MHMRKFNSFEEANLVFLTRKSIQYTLVQITETGYKKSILDATEPIRQYFLECGMHDYRGQAQGQEHKKMVATCLVSGCMEQKTVTSLYRPNTKKGDPRFWPSNVKSVCSPNDILMMLFHDGMLYIVNVTQVDIAGFCASPSPSPLKELISRCHNVAMSVANELKARLCDLSHEWHPTGVLADTGVGRTIEKLLGLEMNCSKLPDYKGIELKSFREKRPGIRSTLFCQVPDWNISKLKSTKEIVRRYGYISEGVLTYQNTIYCHKLNSQGLGLTLYEDMGRLAIEEKRKKENAEGRISYVKVSDIALWRLSVLHQRLLEKHHETFWIEVETKEMKGKEFFRPVLVEHTKNPMTSQFDVLLDTGYISVDLLLSRPSGHGDTIAFKLSKRARPMLFPESEQFVLK